MALFEKKGEKLNKVFFLLSIIIIAILAIMLFQKRFHIYFRKSPYSIKLFEVIALKGKRSFKGPADAFFGQNNNIYVVDSGNSRIMKFNLSGKYLEQWGIEGQTTGEFMVPLYGVAYGKGKKEKIFIVDSGNGRIQVFNRAGNFLYQFGKSSNSSKQLIEPTFAGLAYGRIFVVNSGSNDVLIYFNSGQFYRIVKFHDIVNSASGSSASPNTGVGKSASGNNTATSTAVSSGKAASSKHKKKAKSSVPGAALKKMKIVAGVSLKKPVGMAFSKQYIYISSYSLSKIFVFNRQFDYIGSIGDPGQKGSELKHPVGIQYRNGYLYVANYGRSMITVFKLKNGFNVVKTYNFGKPGTGRRNFNHPSNISISKNGKYLVIADTNNNRVLVYRIYGAE